MEVYIIPTGGLCNRMRAMASGISIAKKYNMKAVIYWNNNNGLKADFKNLFLPIPDDDITIVENRKWLYRIGCTKDYIKRWIPINCLYKTTYNYNIYNNDGHSLILSPSEKNLLISCNSMTPEYNLKSLFRPKASLQTRIDQITQHFPPNTIGVHIRRTDNVQSIERSPLKSFIKRMEREIQKDESVKFYLATDDEDVKQNLLHLFANHIISYPGSINRNNLEGMEFAVVELFCLSRTQRIIGSDYSSYSQMAAEIGGIELEYAHS